LLNPLGFSIGKGKAAAFAADFAAGLVVVKVAFARSFAYYFARASDLNPALGTLVGFHLSHILPPSLWALAWGQTLVAPKQPEKYSMA
jgi:hypothetical protein